ncbi:TPA: NfeD family protein [bacterium]|jgi:membrane protein implicated in regulation of membrane protease activity|nr:NfeD family protein [bacterium]
MMLLALLQSSDYAVWVWLILILATLGLEIMTVDLISIWFSLGALVALILSVLKVPLPFQIAAFIIVSIGLLATVGKWSRKMLKNKTISTNVDSLIGQEIVIIKGADHLTRGEGKVRDVVWTVVCEKGNKVEPGDIAIIERIDGNKLYVKKP